jgi:aryl-phospho-beta-D-glucosidase BglC (GH1 family)
MCTAPHLDCKAAHAALTFTYLTSTHRTTAPPPPAATSGGGPPPAVKLLDDQFVTINGGSPVYLKGYNWFGFNNGQTAPDGLWAGGNVMNTDFKWVIYQLQLLGFNTIRVPFMFK